MMMTRTRAGKALPLLACLVLAIALVFAAGALRPQVAAAAGDDEIPGVALPASPFSRVLGLDTDWDDVYYVYLRANERLAVSMSHPSTYGGEQVNFDLYLFPPGTTSTYSGSEVAWSEKYQDIDRIIYVAPKAGYYYLDVYDDAGAAPYTIAWTKTLLPRKETVTYLSRSDYSPKYGDTVTLTAKLRTSTGAVVAGKTVKFERWDSANDKWVAVGSEVTNSSGNAYGHYVPYNKRYTLYRAKFYGTYDYYASTSSKKGVKPHVYVTAPDGPYLVYGGSSFTVSGYLKPKHSEGTYPVRVYKYVYSGGEWVNKGYVKAKAYDYSSYTKYKAKVTMPSGYSKVRFRVLHPEDSKNEKTWSTYLTYD